MLKTHLAEIRNGQIQILENIKIPERTKVLVTILKDDKQDFWLEASTESLKRIWDNSEDDIYAKDDDRQVGVSDDISLPEESINSYLAQLKQRDQARSQKSQLNTPFFDAVPVDLGPTSAEDINKIVYGGKK